MFALQQVIYKNRSTVALCSLQSDSRAIKQSL